MRRRRAGSCLLTEEKVPTRQPRGFRSPEDDECRLISAEEALASEVLRVAYLDLRQNKPGLKEWWSSDSPTLWCEAINVPVEQVRRRALRGVSV